ncbi:MAG: hypothetical protein KJ592_03080 [Nanoarchaeota archaeon]|nr:hypothetical protein [Nanoarchaeota archaeon]
MATKKTKKKPVRIPLASAPVVPPASSNIVSITLIVVVVVLLMAISIMSSRRSVVVSESVPNQIKVLESDFLKPAGYSKLKSRIDTLECEKEALSKKKSLLLKKMAFSESEARRKSSEISKSWATLSANPESKRFKVEGIWYSREVIKRNLEMVSLDIDSLEEMIISSHKQVSDVACLLLQKDKEISSLQAELERLILEQIQRDLIRQSFDPNMPSI